MVRWAEPMPAELTRIRKSPELGGLHDRGLDLRGVGDVDLREDAADLVGEGLAALLLEVRDDDLRALRGELTDDGGTDAGGAAGDECTGSCDVHGADARTSYRSVVPRATMHGRAAEQDPVGGRPGDREVPPGTSTR